ncbi:MAG: HAD family hydrolase [Bdellovibrionota bacterium]
MKQAVFLDRDGVLNKTLIREGKSYPPGSLSAFEYLPGVIEAVESLRRAGFLLIVVTNQPDVATGKQTRSVVEEIHKKVREELKVHDIKVCYHVDEDRCECRKPKPGMLLDAAKAWNIDLPHSFMVGDRWRDVEAGHAAGCRSIMVGRGYAGEKKAFPDFEVTSLLEASRVILSSSRRIEVER